MAFRLNSRRPVPDQLRRIVRDELAAAADALGSDAPDQDAIHEARKSVKKVRAILRLLEDPLGKDYREANDRLRVAARALASLRDADAALVSLQLLHGHYPTVL